MSTTPTPGTQATPAAGWYPNLSALNLSPQLQNAISQIFTLTYSLRDTTNQQANTVAMTIQYGTRNNRMQFNPQSAPDGSLFYETDNGSIYYQARLSPQSTTRKWYYAGGMAAGAAANRPAATSLGAADTGYLYLATNTGALSWWSGSAWINVT